MVQFEDDEDELAEETRQQEVTEALANLNARYRALFGTDPEQRLSVAEIQDNITERMKEKGLRPYRL